ncbi:MAG TPA: hypothetical protein VGB77_11715, partial [Abditibacteriaceae bacterium]
VLGVWGLLLRPLVTISPAEAQAPKGAKWEYTFYGYDDMKVKNLNVLGKQGWELFSINPNDGTGAFKRRIN